MPPRRKRRAEPPKEDPRHDARMTVIEVWPVNQCQDTAVEAWATYSDGTIMRFRLTVEGRHKVAFGWLIGVICPGRADLFYHPDEVGYEVALLGKIIELPGVPAR